MPKDETTPAVADELAILAARPQRIDVHTFDLKTDEPITKTIRVAPMTLDICGECAEALVPIAQAIGLNLTADDLPRLIASHKDELRTIIAAATGESGDYIGSLPLDQFLALSLKVYEVNHAFFVHRVGPLAKSLVEKMFGGAGPTSSTASPSTGT